MPGDLDPARLFRRLEPARGIVLAVSGGPDSVALMHLAARWRPPRMPMWVASVDHGLRNGSAPVAEAVVARAGLLGLPGRVLAWEGEKPSRGIQARARAARYALLAGFCGDVGASHLVLAHTLDDQAETLLMRLAAGSGLRGLAGMRAETERHGVTLARPFLSVRKDTLLGLCRREGWRFVTDPANEDPRFTRTRWRRLAPLLAAEGLTPERLHVAAARVARADAALDEVAQRAAADAALPAAPGMLAFDAAHLLASPDEIALRVLARALATMCPATAPRLDRLESLLEGLQEARAQGRTLRRSISGSVVALDARGQLALRPEGPRRRGRSASRDASGEAVPRSPITKRAGPTPPP